MFHRGPTYSTQRVKCSTEVLNIPGTMSNVPLGCYTLHGEGPMVQGGAKYSNETVKRSTEVLNIPQPMSNFPLRC